jgi:hypothetical protein
MLSPHSSDDLDYVFWAVTPCGNVGCYGRFGGTYYHQGFSETAVNTYNTVNNKPFY